MNSLWGVLGLALLPALGNFAGGMLAEQLPVGKHRLNKSLHAASGIALAIVSVELMPQALENLSGWWVGIAFALGGISYVVLRKAIDYAQDRSGHGEDTGGMWMIYIAVCVDLLTDGLMIGTGSSVSATLAIALTAGQVLADIPEGYATIATMKEKKLARRHRLLLSLSFALPVLGAAAFAWYLLRDASQSWQMAALSLVAGLLTLAAVEDMLSEAHESADDRSSSLLMFVGGYALFIFVASGLGGQR